MYIHPHVLQNKLRTCPPAQAHKTSVYDINHALLIIACHHPESSANIRSLASHNLYSFDTELEVGKPFRFDAASTLCVLYRQLNGTQAKWLTRLLLKNFGPRKLFPDGLDLKATFRLPKCLEKFALPDREGPGLLSFKSILQRIDSTPPTSPMIASKLMAMSTPLGHLESKVTSAQASNLLPTPPMTNKKHVNALASISKKRKLTSSYPNANKRHLRISLSPPPLRHTQVSTPSSVPPKENKPMTQQLLATTQPSTKTVPTLAPTVIDLTNSQSVHGQHSDSIAITIQTDSSTCPQIVTSSLPISSKRAPAVFESSTSPAKCSKRQVLGSIDHNSQSQNTQVSATSSSCAKDSLQQKPPSKSKSNNSRIRRAGTGMCRLTQTTCQLVNFILLLSPCISDNPWITNSLLAWHGSRFTKSVRTFVHFTSSSQNSQTEKPTRKIILVNPQRTSQTVEFLKHVQKESSLSGGPKQRIDVYDWRLLEYMAKVDRGKEYTYDPWERCKMYTI